MDKYLIHSCYRYGLYCAVGDGRELKSFMNIAHQIVSKIMHEAYLPSTKNNIQTKPNTNGLQIFTVLYRKN